MKNYTDIFIDLDNTLYDTKTTDRALAVEGAHELLDYLRAKGYRLHILSNGSRTGRMSKLEAIGVTDYFVQVVTSDDCGTSKPDVRFFRYALTKAGCEADGCIMIGDNYDTDIAGAHEAGLDTILFNRWQPGWVPPGPVTHRVDSLREIMQIL